MKDNETNSNELVDNRRFQLAAKISGIASFLNSAEQTMPAELLEPIRKELDGLQRQFRADHKHQSAASQIGDHGTRPS